MSGQTPLIKTPETPVIAALQLWAIVRTWYQFIYRWRRAGFVVHLSVDIWIESLNPPLQLWLNPPLQLWLNLPSTICNSCLNHSILFQLWNVFIKLSKYPPSEIIAFLAMRNKSWFSWLQSVWFVPKLSLKMSPFIAPGISFIRLSLKMVWFPLKNAMPQKQGWLC